MGSKTYEEAVLRAWPYGNKGVYVLSSRGLKLERKNVSFHSGDLEALVDKVLRKKHQNIWLVGGPLLANTFLCKGWVDEIVLSILPILLGDGILLFDNIGIEQQLHLKDVSAFRDGMVDLTYEVLK